MLSKSRITRGLQCHKSLWLHKHRKDLQEISDNQQAIFDSGTKVGVLAQELFPGGVDATAGHDWPSYQTAKITKELIAAGQQTIYEATFVRDNVLVAVDILTVENGNWQAYEVKSSSEVKDYHLPDAAIQYYVMSGHLEVSSISIIHLNKKYVRQGELDIHQLFAKHDVTLAIQEWLPKMPELITEMESVQSQDSEPEIDIGPHCSKPFSCDFKAHCWRNVPDFSMLELSWGKAKKWELYYSGIHELKDMPDIELSTLQRLQVSAARTGETKVDTPAIQSFIANLEFPVYHLDYETIGPAVPMFDSTKTYQQIPFQYSLHIQESMLGEVIHHEFLADPDTGDFREEFIQHLLSRIGEKGTVLVYNINFEKRVTNDLAKAFPQYENELLSIVERMQDLMVPFKNGSYYSPQMRGSYSIKKVLPALVPELKYSDLEIQEGGTASTTFSAMMNGSFKGDELATRKALLDYCKMDTYAMVKILASLEAKTMSD